MSPTSTTLVADPRSLERLRASAGATPEKAVREAAKQFEVLFVNMLLKSMREATPQDGPLNSDQTRMYTSMLDQQLSQAIAGRGIGLADVMTRQLSRGGSLGVDAMAPKGGAARVKEIPPALAAAATAPTSLAEPPTGPTPRARDFIDKMWPHAVTASKATGIPAHFIIGQAALESGWGSREIKGTDGAATHNLFGVKVGRAWNGASADTTTHEFVNGVKQKVVEKFRAYASYAEAFMDYANLLKSNPRYAPALQAGNDAKAFAEGLQKAGYATDPAYASKLTRIITGSVMRQGLSG